MPPWVEVRGRGKGMTGAGGGFSLSEYIEGMRRAGRCVGRRGSAGVY